MPGTAPQLLYENTLPEINGNIEQSTEQSANRNASKPMMGLIRIIAALAVVAVAIGVGVGIGVGIWHTRRFSPSTSKYDILIGLHLSLTHFASPPVASPSVSNSPTPRISTNVSTAQTILNDTSLAAVILANGDRQLYFQDNTGLIRYAVRTASTNQWDTSPHLSFNSSAKNHTPLAVTATGSQNLEVVRHRPQLYIFTILVCADPRV